MKVTPPGAGARAHATPSSSSPALKAQRAAAGVALAELRLRGWQAHLPHPVLPSRTMEVEREFWAAMAEGIEGVPARLGSEDRSRRLGAAWFLCARSFGGRELPTSGQRQLSLIGFILTHEVRGLEVLAQDDPAPNVRIQAIVSLSRFVEVDHPSVTAVLAARSTDDPDELVRVASIEAMALRCPSQRHASVTNAWLRDSSSKVRRAAMDAQRTWGTDAAHLVAWLATAGEGAITLGLEHAAGAGTKLQWHEVPVSIQSGSISIRARLVHLLIDNGGVPVRFWLECARESDWLYKRDRAALRRIGYVLERYATECDTVPPADAGLLVSAREHVGLLTIATTSSCACRHHWGIDHAPDPTKKIGIRLFDAVPLLWQSLSELDPTFDPESDEVAEHVRWHLRHSDDDDRWLRARWRDVRALWNGGDGDRTDGDRTDRHCTGPETRPRRPHRG